MRHKLKQDLQKKERTLNSFRSKLVILFQGTGVEGLFVARSIEHKAGGMNSGLYAGYLDWDKAVKAMVKVDCKRAA